MDIKAISLFELNQGIKKVIKENFSVPLWVIAEISELKENRNGHCYLELIEKDASGISIKARSRAIIWAYTYRMLKPYFETTTGQVFQAGIKVMVQVTVEYHEQYGLSLEIKDIEPAFTIGDLERQKQEIIDRLLKEGVLDMNKQTDLSICPQRLAIISSSTAAGYKDFMDQLTKNPYGYVFYTKLFQAMMQGAETETSIMLALDSIYEYEDFFDAVIIIRGGGASIDLNSFNSYDLAFMVTQFPLPVLTGIGHEKDETILDMVAYQKLKTPTAVAGFLVDKLNTFEAHIDDLKLKTTDLSTARMREESNKLVLSGHKVSAQLSKNISSQKQFMDKMNARIPRATDKLFRKNEVTLRELKHNLGTLATRKLKKQHEKILVNSTTCVVNSKNFLKSSKLKLHHIENIANHINPENVLRKGYSITTKNGQVIRSIKSIKKGDQIETLLHDGKVKSTITCEIAKKKQKSQ